MLFDLRITNFLVRIRCVVTVFNCLHNIYSGSDNTKAILSFWLIKKLFISIFAISSSWGYCKCLQLSLKTIWYNNIHDIDLQIKNRKNKFLNRLRCKRLTARPILDHDIGQVSMFLGINKCFCDLCVFLLF